MQNEVRVETIKGIWCSCCCFRWSWQLVEYRMFSGDVIHHSTRYFWWREIQQLQQPITAIALSDVWNWGILIWLMPTELFWGGFALFWDKTSNYKQQRSLFAQHVETCLVGPRLFAVFQTGQFRIRRCRTLQESDTRQLHRRSVWLNHNLFGYYLSLSVPPWWLRVFLANFGFNTCYVAAFCCWIQGWARLWMWKRHWNSPRIWHTCVSTGQTNMLN